MNRFVSILACALSAVTGSAAAQALPRYQHVFVIVEENKDYDQILDPAAAPTIARLAKAYGNARRFYAEVHPSEGNYVALLGGDTFGIHDDDAFYCTPGKVDPSCAGSAQPGYQDHTTSAPFLGQQLEQAGLTWRGYYEDIPGPGSLAVTAGPSGIDDGARKSAFYAAKHSGFVNFAAVQSDPQRADRLVGFDRLKADLASGNLPNFALIVPNQCNEMHGLSGPTIPPDCQSENKAGLIARGDRVVGELVSQIQKTATWTSKDNVAIVVTFDEGAGKTREGCCGVTPAAISNFGGGHIPTVVITNHGPRGVADDTPYSHYSLLRTIEDVFGLPTHLRHAADPDVVTMTPLFAVGRN
ncbi:MAG TPA: alkaline phosphatase family protein [Caulobacteraceae bacterium]|nr:alkaline phosphatase family protein [Caulobacteraceae bacterium]